MNESGLYNLIFRSNKPEARAFRKFVTSEVLPCIRRTGRYNVDELYEIIKKQQTQIKQLERRVKFLTSPRAKKERKRRAEVENADEWLASGRIAAIKTNADGWIPFDKIMEDYLEFCKDANVKRVGKNLLGKKLQRKFEHKKRRDTTWYCIIIGNR